ncbi:hypothetical protein CCACVL1_24572, partial [Corchorus capsularis]
MATVNDYHQGNTQVATTGTKPAAPSAKT